MTEKIKVYEIGSGLGYSGTALVAAKSAKEANRLIKAFADDDPYDFRGSGGMIPVSEKNVVDGLFAEKEGIVSNGIVWTG